MNIGVLQSEGSEQLTTSAIKVTFPWECHLILRSSRNSDFGIDRSPFHPK